MSIDDLSDHPIADIFPLLKESDLTTLAQSVAAQGLREPIWLFEGKILDGRNRYRACRLAGVEVTTQEFKGSATEAIGFVWSVNVHRRHLDSSQMAIADAKRAKVSDVYADVKKEANERQLSGKGSDGSGGRGKKKTLVKKLTKVSPKGEKEAPSVSQQIDSENARKTDAVRAKALGTNRTYIHAADRILEEYPEKAAEIERGEKTISRVNREIRQEEMAARTPAPPTGKYRVIYADPPWKYGDQMAISKDGLGESYGPADAHYPQMTITELCELPIKDLAEENAVLFLWTTAPLLEDAFKIVRAWGFIAKTQFIWDKVKHNMGHYSSVRHEQLLVCTRGSCLPDVKKLFDSVQSIERGAHSEKPGEFRTIIETLYTRGEKIELFARGQHEGWKTWGQGA